MPRAIAVVLDAKSRIAVPVDDARWLATELRAAWNGRWLTPSLEAAIRIERAVAHSASEQVVRFSSDEASAVTAVLRCEQDLSEPLRSVCQWFVDHPPWSAD